MKTLTLETFHRMTRDGRAEAMRDLNEFGTIEIRLTASGLRRTVRLVDVPGRTHAERLAAVTKGGRQ